MESRQGLHRVWFNCVESDASLIFLFEHDLFRKRFPRFGIMLEPCAIYAKTPGVTGRFELRRDRFSRRYRNGATTILRAADGLRPILPEAVAARERFLPAGFEPWAPPATPLPK